MNLALFDFDGTITTKDTFIAFIYFAVAPRRIKVGKVLLAPVISGYKLGIVSAARAREFISGFGFRGRPIEELRRLGRQYAERVVPRYIRPKALKRIQWHQNRGDKVVVVSASLDVYLKPWCDKYGLELICSKFEVQNGRVKGISFGSDCSGSEKASRVLEKYHLEAYEVIYAYGDTAEDKPMLDLADVRFYRWKRMDD